MDGVGESVSQASVSVGFAAYLSQRRNEPRSVALLVSGILGVLIGVAALLVPGVTALVLLYFIAAWAVVHGVFEIVAAIQLRKVIAGEFWLILGGVLSVAFGVLMFVFPAAGALAVLLWIGVFAIVFGIVLLAFAFRLRGWGRDQRRVQHDLDRRDASLAVLHRDVEVFANEDPLLAQVDIGHFEDGHGIEGVRGALLAHRPFIVAPAGPCWP